MLLKSKICKNLTLSVYSPIIMFMRKFCFTYFFLIVITSFFSCRTYEITKRKYNPGYHISSIQKENKTVENTVAFQQQHCEIASIEKMQIILPIINSKLPDSSFLKQKVLSNSDNNQAKIKYYFKKNKNVKSKVVFAPNKKNATAVNGGETAKLILGIIGAALSLIFGIITIIGIIASGNGGFLLWHYRI